MDLTKLDYNKYYLYDLFYNNNSLIKIYLIKTFNNAKTYYHLKLFLTNKDNTLEIGYLYFFINKDQKTSDFIGVKIRPEYRNLGYASLLISHWLTLSLNNGLEYLKTNRKQKKPFILYLLKTFAFEIPDVSTYITNPSVIYICRRLKDEAKILLFKDIHQRKKFASSRIIKTDNYEIITSLDNNTKILDQVILNKIYNLKDPTKAYKKILTLKNYHNNF